MYRVQLNNFEGPLDLLLFFIKRDELDIYNIPISDITEQFLQYINLMEDMDLDVASEFVLMASMLMSVKAKMMLPRVDVEEEVLDEKDPRYELVRRLLEYKRYKEMAEQMFDLDEDTRKIYARGCTEEDIVEKQATGEALKEVTLFDLISAFKKVLSDIEHKNMVHRVEKVEVTIEQQCEFVLVTLQKKGCLSFSNLCSEIKSRIIVMVTFLSVLEMIKEQQINLFLEEDPTEFFLDLKPVDEIIRA